MKYTLPYDTADIELNAAKKIAAELRATGEYEKVVVRKVKPGLNGVGEFVDFAQIILTFTEDE